MGQLCYCSWPLFFYNRYTNQCTTTFFFSFFALWNNLLYVISYLFFLICFFFCLIIDSTFMHTNFFSKLLKWQLKVIKLSIVSRSRINKIAILDKVNYFISKIRPASRKRCRSNEDYLIRVTLRKSRKKRAKKLIYDSFKSHLLSNIFNKNKRSKRRNTIGMTKQFNSCSAFRIIRDLL